MWNVGIPFQLTLLDGALQSYDQNSSPCTPPNSQMVQPVPAAAPGLDFLASSGSPAIYYSRLEDQAECILSSGETQNNSSEISSFKLPDVQFSSTGTLESTLRFSQGSLYSKASGNLPGPQLRSSSHVGPLDSCNGIPLLSGASWPDLKMGRKPPQQKQPNLQLTKNLATLAATSGDISLSPIKARIRWTTELHEQFVECVNQLGGAEKATPKAILRLMGAEGLTIFHVKSHLQKYRLAKYVPESPKYRTATEMPNLDPTTCRSLQIKEALQLQLDVQRYLHEQLEVQRKMQLRIEEQGRQLRKMFEEQQRTKRPILQSQHAQVNQGCTESQSSEIHQNDEQPAGLDDNQIKDMGVGFGCQDFYQIPAEK